jgi:hypothetical protein
MANIEKIENKIDNLLEMMLILNKRISNIENYIKNIDSNEDIDIINILPQKFEIDTNIVKKCLEGNCIKSDLVLVKEMYFKENIPPIRYNINKNIEFMLNNGWKCDDVYLFKTIINNIKSCYLIVNNFDNYENNLEQFMKNQQYIINIISDTYTKSFIKMFKMMLNKI